MISESDITDKTYKKLETSAQTGYLETGLTHYVSLALQYGIDLTLIPEPNPYIPARIQNVCVLMAMCKDLIGSEWRQIRDGLTIDVYQAKLNSLNEELQSNLSLFTPKMCDYVVEGVEGSSSVSFKVERG